MWGCDGRSSSTYLCSEGSSPSLKLGGLKSFDASLFMDTQLCVGDADLFSVTPRNRKNTFESHSIKECLWFSYTFNSSTHMNSSSTRMYHIHATFINTQMVS